MLLVVSVGSLLAASRFAQLAQSEREAKNRAVGANLEAIRRGEAEAGERYRAEHGGGGGSLQLQNVDAARRSLDLTRPSIATGNGGTSPASSISHRPSSAGVTGRSSTWPSAPTADASRACSRDGTARVWDVQTGQMLATLREHDPGVDQTYYRVHFTADGKRLITAGKDHNLRVWDVAAGDSSTFFAVHSDEIPPSTSVATAHASRPRPATDATVRLWDAWTGQCTAVVPSRPTRCL